MNGSSALSGEGPPELRVYGYAGQSYTDTLTGNVWGKPERTPPGTTQWKLISDGVEWEDSVSVMEFGAKGDGVSDDLWAIQAAEDYISKYIPNGTLLFPSRCRFAVSGSILKREKTNWTGGGEIVRQSPTGNAYPIVYAYEVNEWSIVGVRIEAAKFDQVTGEMSNFNTDNVCVLAVGCENFSILNNTFRKFRNGVRVVMGAWFRIVGNYFDAETGLSLEQYFETGSGGLPGTSHGDISCYLGYQSGWGSVVNNTAMSQFYIISNNRCRSVGLDQGIAISNQIYNPHPGLITKNLIVGKRSGIQLYTGSNPDQGHAYSASSLANIEGNLVAYCRESGIYLRGYTGAQITNNITYRVDRRGSFASQSGGGIVVRVAPELVFNSPQPDFRTPTVIRGNLLIDTGNPTASANNSNACDGAIVARDYRMVIENNVCIQSFEYGFDRSGKGIASGAGNGQKFGEFVVRDNYLFNFNEPVRFTSGNFNAQISESAMIFSGNRCMRFSVTTLFPSCPIIGSNNLFEDGLVGVSVRGAPKSRWNDNQFRRCDIGIRIQDLNSLSSMQRAIAGVPSGNPGRGASWVLRDNDFTDVTTPVTLQSLDSGASGVYVRVKNAIGNTLNGSNIDKMIVGNMAGVPSATTGGGATYENGDLFYVASDIALGSTMYSVCIKAGTAGAFTVTPTATTDGTSTVAFSTVNELFTGAYISLENVLNGPFKVLSVDYNNNTAEVSPTPDTVVIGDTVTYSQPEWGSVGLGLQPRQTPYEHLKILRGGSVPAGIYSFGSVGSLADRPASFMCRFPVPTTTLNSPTRLIFIGSTSDPTTLPTDCFAISIETSGNLTIRQIGASGDERMLEWSGFQDAFSGKDCILCVSFPEGNSTTSPVVYLDGVSVTGMFASSTSGTPPNWMDAAMDTTYCIFSHRATGRGAWYPARFILGTLSASEMSAFTSLYTLPLWYDKSSADSTQLLVNNDFSDHVGDTFTGWVVGENVGAASITDGIQITRLPGFIANTSAANLIIQRESFNPLLGFSKLPIYSKIVIRVTMRPIDGGDPDGSGAIFFSRRGLVSAGTAVSIPCVSSDWTTYTREILGGSGENDFGFYPRPNGAEISSIELFAGGPIAKPVIQRVSALDDQSSRFGGLLTGFMPIAESPYWRIIGTTSDNASQELLGGPVFFEADSNMIQSWTVNNIESASSVTIDAGSIASGDDYASGISVGSGLNKITPSIQYPPTTSIWITSSGTDRLKHTITGHQL